MDEKLQKFLDFFIPVIITAIMGFVTELIKVIGSKEAIDWSSTLILAGLALLIQLLSGLQVWYKNKGTSLKQIKGITKTKLLIGQK